MYPEKKILIVEDDLNLGFLLAELLENEHFSVKLCKDGQMGLQAVRRYSFDLCLLDVMMPRLDGFSLSRQIRELRPGLPFLFLTAKSRKEDMMNAAPRIILPNLSTRTSSSARSRSSSGAAMILNLQRKRPASSGSVAFSFTTIFRSCGSGSR